MTITPLLIADILIIGLLAFGAFGSIRFRRPLGSKRLGRLSNVGVPTAEASRKARLQQLGITGTYTVHNCGKILHVDYERGTLTVEREGHEGR